MKKIIANIEFTSVLTGLKIKERNEVFIRLSDEGKRLEIAWDALQMVTKRLVKPSYGVYWNESLLEIEGDSKMLQKVLNTNSFYDNNPCEVCQRGLLMLSQIRLGNSIDSSNLSRDNGSEHNIRGFDLYVFSCMEDEYEISRYGHPHAANTEEKLANICCNILVNGNFNIADKKDYLICKQ